MSAEYEGDCGRKVCTRAPFPLHRMMLGGPNGSQLQSTIINQLDEKHVRCVAPSRCHPRLPALASAHPPRPSHSRPFHTGPVRSCSCPTSPTPSWTASLPSTSASCVSQQQPARRERQLAHSTLPLPPLSSRTQAEHRASTRGSCPSAPKARTTLWRPLPRGVIAWGVMRSR